VILESKLLQSELRFFDEQPNGFAHVQSATTTKGDKSIAVTFAKGGGSGSDVLFNGVRIYRGKNQPLFVSTFSAKGLAEQLKRLCGQKARVCYHQRPFYGKLTQPSRQF